LRSWKPILQLGLDVTMLLGGLALILLLTVEIRNSTEAKAWPITAGQITSSDLQTCAFCDGPKYTVRVRYEYVTAGQAYVGPKVLFGTHSFDSQTEADALLRTYPSGASVPVHYKADNPGQSVLEPRFAMAFSDVILLGGLAVFESWLLLHATRSLQGVTRYGRQPPDPRDV
jgi:hypothetical protein